MGEIYRCSVETPTPAVVTELQRDEWVEFVVRIDGARFKMGCVVIMQFGDRMAAMSIGLAGSHRHGAG